MPKLLSILMLYTTINFISGCDLTVFHNFESSTIPEKIDTTKTPPSKTLSKNATDAKIIDLAKPFLPNSSPFDPSLPIEKFEFSNNDLKNIQDITAKIILIF